MKRCSPLALAGATLVLACVVLCACEAHEVPETVIVKMDDSKIGETDNLRLYRGMECNGEYEVPVRNTENVYSFSTQSLQGAFGEVTQELALCIVRDKEFQLVWSSRHGGGPARIDLNCLESTCEEKLTY